MQPASAKFRMMASSHCICFKNCSVDANADLLYSAAAHPCLRPSQLLQYHIVPAGAYSSTQLTPGMSLTTALPGAAPLTVGVDDGQIEINAVATDSGGDVIQPNIAAGTSIVHVIDGLLVPATMRAAG
jgi:uncharacterized surface protein with fasciclin (FAS1) repeats